MGICLVLGGGGARGIAHVGAIRALLEHDIQIDQIIGTSAGAMVGGLFAYNPDIDWLENFILTTNKKHVLKRDWTTLRGYSRGKAFTKHINKFIHNATFDDLKIPFTAIAADLHTGELVPINTGSVAMAQLCSSALPPIYTPIQYMDRTLVDGGCVESVASDYAQTINTSQAPIVAVQVGIDFPDGKVNSVRAIMMRFIQIRTVYFDALCARSADVIIRPDIPGADILNDSDKHGYIEKGYQAAISKIEHIHAALRNQSVESL